MLPSIQLALRFFLLFFLLLPVLVSARVWQPLGQKEENLTAFYYTHIHNMAISPEGVPHIIFQDEVTENRGIVKKFVDGKWEQVGTGYIAEDYSTDMSLAFAPDGSLYAVYHCLIGGTTRVNVRKLVNDCWSDVGIAGMGPDLAPSLTFSQDGTPYLAFSSPTFTSGGVMVRKFEGGRWSMVGPTTGNLVSSMSSNYNKLIQHNNEFYVAYADNGNDKKISVKKLVNNVWTLLGTEGFSSGEAAYIDMAFSRDGVLHVAYQDGGNGGKVTVKKWSGGNWTDVGQFGLSSGKSSWANINFDSDNTPLIFYLDESLDNKTVFGKFVGGAWSLREVSANASDYTSLNPRMRVDENGEIYISYTDQASNYGLNVKKMVGDQFIGVGISGVSPEGVSQLKLKTGHDRLPYLAYVDVNDQYRASVKKYMDGRWQLVGKPSFTNANLKFIDLAIDQNNVPYMVYGDNSTNFSIMKFDGTNWTGVGNLPKRAQWINPKIAIGTDNVPYLVFADYASGGRSLVMKFNGTSWVQVGDDLSMVSVAETAITVAKNNVLYVAHVDRLSSRDERKLGLKKLVAGVWQTVGADYLSSSVKVSGISLAVADDGTAYVSFCDEANGSRVRTKKFADGTWTDLGSYLSKSSAYPTTTIISKNGDPIVGLQDYANRWIASVVTFKNGNWTPLSTTPLSNVHSTTIALAADSDGEIYVAYGVSQALVAKLVSGVDSPPLIYSFTPSATEGGMVVISGEHLTGTTEVKFGGVAASSFKIVSPKEIIAKVGNGVSGALSIRTPKGEVSKDGFTYILPPPVITSLSPLRASIGATVQVIGKYFSTNKEDNIVYFGPVRATVVAASSTVLQVLVPAHSTYSHVTVLVGGKIAYSPLPFNVAPAQIFVSNEINFFKKRDFATGKRPMMIRLGDIDGDGKADVLVTHSDQNYFHIYLNQSTINEISFAAPVQVECGFSPNALTIADMDGDGKLDVFMARGYSGVFALHRNTSTRGNLSFAAPSEYGRYSYPFGTAAGDLDLDGRADFVGASINMPWNVFVSRNVAFDGSYVYTEKPIDLGYASKPHSVTVGDLNGDRYPELISNQGDGIYIFRNQSVPGGIQLNQVDDGLRVADYSSSEPQLADLDGDGRLDIITSNSTVNQMAIYRNESTAVSIIFSARKMFGVPKTPGHVAVADFDGDGLADLAVVNSTNTVAVLKNTSTLGNIQLAESINFETGQLPSYIAAGDLNGDGYADLVVSNSNDHTFTVLRNANGRTALLPTSFTVAVRGATCSGNSNGSIRIIGASVQKYVAAIISGTTRTTHRFTKEIDVENLKAGTYEIEIYLEEQSSEISSYTVVVAEPKPLSVYSSVKREEGSLVLTLAGADRYYITLNGKEYQTARSSIILPLVEGTNSLVVRTDLACQDVFTEEVSYGSIVTVYPNPVDRMLNIILDKPRAKNVNLTLFNAIGTIVLRKNLTDVVRGFEVDLSRLSAGMYILKLNIDGIQVQNKINKK